MKKTKEILKRALTLLMALVMVFGIQPFTPLITNASDAEVESQNDGRLAFADMQVGKKYSARFDYSKYPDIYLYKLDENGQVIVNTKDGTQMKDTFPQELTVVLLEGITDYVYVINEDWPEKFDEYRIIEFAEIIVIACIDPEPDDGFIRGQVGLTDGSNTINELTVAAGEKSYVFTNLGNEIGELATYRWQMRIDEENDLWADIADYFYPYAIVSEALIANAREDDGKATLRCIVTEGDKQYVSNNVRVSVEQPMVSLSQFAAPQKAVSHVGKESEILQDDTRAIGDAFHITIAYVYLHENSVDPTLNGSTAANALTITLPPNTGFSHPITSPYVAGYKPYVDWNGNEGEEPEGYIEYHEHKLIPADKIEFDDQRTEITITVYYVPQTVNYKVRYLKQNLQNDEYTEWKTVFKTGTADTVVADNLAVAETGFSPLYYEKTTRITSDGETVVDIYYDRIYYLVNYEIGEGAYGVMPSLVRYGTSLIIGNPTRPGYTFDGWKLTSVKDSTEEDADELLTDANLTTTYQKYNVTKANSQIREIAHNLVYTAQWTETDVSFAIVYWKENANDNGYSCWGVQKVTGHRPGDEVTVDGTNIPQSIHNGEKNYFTYNSVLSDTKVTVKGDGSAVANVYYYRNIYTLTFTANALCNIPEGHTHTEACYDYICNSGNHVHDENCTLICTIEEHRHDPVVCKCNVTVHTHVDGCCSIPGHKHIESCCSKEAHTHVDSCCSKEEHEHGLFCLFGCSKEEHTHGDGQCNYVCGKTEHSHGDGSCNYICGNAEHIHGSGNCNYVCGNGEHVHGDGKCNYTCGKTAHTHGKTCYDCGEDLHEHVDACKRLICAIPQNHTHNDTCNSTNRSSTVAIITGKYGSDIRNRFPLTGRNDTSLAGWWWKVPTGATSLEAGKYIVSLDQIPGENLTFTGTDYTGNYDLAYIYYYVEALPGAPYVENLPNAGNKHYELYKEVITVDYGQLSDKEEFHPIVGFTKGNYYPNGIFDSGVEKENYLYYTRNSHTLQFHSNNVHLTDLDKTVLYGASMSDYASILPSYPFAFEPNAYQFAGWYTTPGCYDGTEYDFTVETMPDQDVLLYAKWEPTSWDVEVYLDEDQKILLDKQTVPFDTRITEPKYREEQAKYPEYEDLIWTGWYYTDANGNEVRFDFNTMAIKTNYNGTVDPVTGEQYPSAIYAKWTSEVPIPYIVEYVTKDENGNYVNVADPTEGVALVGISKSFIAKAGDEIYPEYRESHEYLPVRRSITHKMSAISSENVIRFEYIKTTEITYTIKHVFKDSRFIDVIGEDTFTLSWDYPIQTSDPTFSSKLTVEFDADLYTTLIKKHPTNGDQLWNDIIVDLSPDAYMQELIITTDSANNVIVFNWADHGETFLYQVVHYFQKVNYDENLPADEQYEAEYYQEFVGAYAEQSSVTINVTAIEMHGFKKNEGMSDSSKEFGKEDDIIKNPRVFKIYYDREKFTYTVQHIYGGNVDTETKTAIYEQDVTETAKTDLKGYVIADPAQAEQTVSITHDGQIISFYYVAQTVIFNYQVVDNVGGYVMPPQETVKIGDPVAGGTPTAAEGYIFIGWYTDADATTEVNASWVGENGKLKPVASVDDANKMITFYAKFAPHSLTIKNAFDASVNPNPALDWANQGFIYHIQGEGVDIRVAVLVEREAVILGLPTGTYTVTVESEWSWRYDSIIDINLDSGLSTISERSGMKWELTFGGSDTMTVVYENPDMDVSGTTESNSGYFVTDNAHN